MVNKFENMFTGFDTIHERWRQTDGRHTRADNESYFVTHDPRDPSLN